MTIGSRVTIRPGAVGHDADGVEYFHEVGGGGVVTDEFDTERGSTVVVQLDELDGGDEVSFDPDDVSPEVPRLVRLLGQLLDLSTDPARTFDPKLRELALDIWREVTRPEPNPAPTRPACVGADPSDTAVHTYAHSPVGDGETCLACGQPYRDSVADLAADTGLPPVVARGLNGIINRPRGRR